jgi:hypothetical protein
LLLTAGAIAQQNSLTTAARFRPLVTRSYFAASGKTGYGVLGGDEFVWDAHEIARREFRLLSRTESRTDLPKLAAQWGDQVSAKLQSDLVQHRIETLSGGESDTLTSAVFATFNSDGVYIVTGKISYHFVADGRPEAAFTITNTFKRPQAIFIGDTEIADEFNAAATSRAIQWKREGDVEARSASDAVAFFALRIVELSIAYHPGKMINGKMMPTIGGPVDAVRLVRGRGIEWIQRKKGCPGE